MAWENQWRIHVEPTELAHQRPGIVVVPAGQPALPLCRGARVVCECGRELVAVRQHETSAHVVCLEGATVVVDGD